MGIDYDISVMRSKVAHERMVNSQLRSELYQLESGIHEATNAWEQLTGYINGTLINGTNRVQNSHEITLRAYEMEGQIEKMYALYKNIELANKKIRECKNRIYYEFANYRAVRKIVEAMLNNIEVSFVSDQALKKAVEIQHLQLPDYWLTCALLAIMAWKEDDRVLADRALQRACKLDLKNTAVFFFAFYVRHGKTRTALKWFDTYTSCPQSGEDQANMLLLFSIAVNSIKEGADDALRDAADRFIHQMISELARRDGYSEDAMIYKIMHCLNPYAMREPINYPALTFYSSEKDYLWSQLNAARTNMKYLDMILKTVNVTAEERNNHLNQFIDDVIARSNKSEKEVTNQIVYNEYVISHQGNVEAAKASYAEYIRHNETELNIVDEMIEWIYHPTDRTGNAERRMMFLLTKDFQQRAIQNMVANYRSRYKRQLNVTINEYQTTMDFGNQTNENQKAEAYFQAKEASLLSEVKTWPCFIWFAIAVLAVVGAIFLELPILFVGTLIGIVGGILTIVGAKNKRANISKNCALELQNTTQTIGTLFEEFARYESEYAYYDAYFNNIEAEFAKM